MRLPAAVALCTVLLVAGTMDSTAQAPDAFIPGKLRISCQQHVTGAQLDVCAENAGISVVASDQKGEGFLAYFNQNGDGSRVKTASISTVWADAEQRIGATRYNSSYYDASLQRWRDDIQIVTWGGKGTAINPPSHDPRWAPGAGTLKVYGDIIATGRVIEKAPW